MSHNHAAIDYSADEQCPEENAAGNVVPNISLVPMPFRNHSVLHCIELV